MAYAFIHGEVKGSGASVEFKGNGLDLLDLTIQIVGSVVAEVPEPLRPYVIKKIQDKIPDAVQNDLEAQGKGGSGREEGKASRWRNGGVPHGPAVCRDRAGLQGLHCGAGRQVVERLSLEVGI